jgi:hypothetical protein
MADEPLAGTSFRPDRAAVNTSSAFAGVPGQQVNAGQSRAVDARLLRLGIAKFLRDERRFTCNERALQWVGPQIQVQNTSTLRGLRGMELLFKIVKEIGVQLDSGSISGRRHDANTQTGKR